jgi:hypothetical protein
LRSIAPSQPSPVLPAGPPPLVLGADDPIDRLQTARLPAPGS